MEAIHFMRGNPFLQVTILLHLALSEPEQIRHPRQSACDAFIRNGVERAPSYKRSGMTAGRVAAKEAFGSSTRCITLDS